jgi:hypothetical protein
MECRDETRFLSTAVVSTDQRRTAMNETKHPLNESCILIEGPQWGDADFYGKWLLAAAEAEALWKRALKYDPVFAMEVDRVTIAYIPNFGIGSTVLLSLFVDSPASVIVALDDERIELVEELSMMAAMGFFALTGERYQMVVPTRLDTAIVKDAVLKLARTEDGDYFLHPEHLLTTLPRAAAKIWQERLRVMNESNRCADRALLLDAEDANLEISAASSEARCWAG